MCVRETTRSSLCTYCAWTLLTGKRCPVLLSLQAKTLSRKWQGRVWYQTEEYCPDTLCWGRPQVQGKCRVMERGHSEWSVKCGKGWGQGPLFLWGFGKEEIPYHLLEAADSSSQEICSGQCRPEALSSMPASAATVHENHLNMFALGVLPVIMSSQK